MKRLEEILLYWPRKIGCRPFRMISAIVDPDLDPDAAFVVAQALNVELNAYLDATDPDASLGFEVRDSPPVMSIPSAGWDSLRYRREETGEIIEFRHLGSSVPASISPAYGVELAPGGDMETFTVTHSAKLETGDLSEFDASFGPPNVIAGAAKYGSFGMECAMNASSSGRFNIDGAGCIAVAEAWFKQNTATVAASAPIFLAQGVGTWNWFAYIQANTVGAFIWDDALVGHGSTGGVIGAGWHHVRSVYRRSTAPGANNGYCYVYLDGIRVISITGIDNDTMVMTLFDFGDPGAIWGGVGTYYLDNCFVLEDATTIPCPTFIGASGLAESDGSPPYAGERCLRVESNLGVWGGSRISSGISPTPGKFYRMGGAAKLGSGSGPYGGIQRSGVWDWPLYFQVVAGWISWLGTGRIPGGGSGTFHPCSGYNGSVSFADSLTLKEILLPSMLSDFGEAGDDPTITLRLTIPNQYQAGILINLDSAGDPQNYIYIGLERGINWNKIVVNQCESGVVKYRALLPFTYVANAILKVKKVGGVIWIWYNGNSIGSAISVNQNGYQGFARIASDPGISFADLDVWARIY